MCFYSILIKVFFHFFVLWHLIDILFSFFLLLHCRSLTPPFQPPFTSFLFLSFTLRLLLFPPLLSMFSSLLIVSCPSMFTPAAPPPPVGPVRSKGSCVLVMRPDVGGVRRRRCFMSSPALCHSPVESPPTWTNLLSWESPSTSCGCTASSDPVRSTSDLTEPECSKFLSSGCLYFSLNFSADIFGAWHGSATSVYCMLAAFNLKCLFPALGLPLACLCLVLKNERCNHLFHRFYSRWESERGVWGRGGGGRSNGRFLPWGAGWLHHGDDWGGRHDLPDGKRQQTHRHHTGTFEQKRIVNN